MPRDAVTLVLPVPDAGERLGKSVTAWADALARLGREFEILVVDDGSPDPTPFAKLGLLKHVRVLTHATRRGYGASLRTAVADARHPILVHASTDDAYTPNDLSKLLDRLDVTDELSGLSPTLVSGCRAGRPAPAALRLAGRAWRLFCRVALGLPLAPPAAWLGFTSHAYSYWVWAVFGVPLVDPHSAFKVWRTAFLKRVPIQSGGDFVHTELVAKATFLTSVLDEVPLSPRTPSPPPTPSVWPEMVAVFRAPDFGDPLGVRKHPAAPTPPPGEPAAVTDAPPPTEPPPAAPLALAPAP